MHVRYLAILVLLGAIWGSSFPFVQFALESFPPLTVVALRLSGSGLVLTLVLYLQGQRYPRSLRARRDLFMVGMVGSVIPMFLVTWGEQYISSGLAAILIAITPLFTLLLGLFWGHQQPLRTVHIAGIVLGFIGVLVALDISGLALGSASALGVLAVLVAALSYAMEALYGHKAFHNTPALVAAAGILTSGAVVVTPIALVHDGLPTLTPSLLALVGIVGLTLFSSALAYILFFWVLERIGATRAAMVTYLVPIFALIFGWLWLGEVLHLHVGAGLALVLLGIALTNRRTLPEPAPGEPAQYDGSLVIEADQGV
jgi:drug/metabolite transporter (DMT)-like permease